MSLRGAAGGIFSNGAFVEVEGAVSECNARPARCSCCVRVDQRVFASAEQAAATTRPLRVTADDKYQGLCSAVTRRRFRFSEYLQRVFQLGSSRHQKKEDIRFCH